MRTIHRSTPASLILLAAVLTGCSPAPLVAARVLDTASPPVQIPEVVPASTPAPASQSPVTPAISPAVVAMVPIALEPPPGKSPDAIELEIPAAPDPLDIGWRPPLYPIPWAAGPYDHFYLDRPIMADENFMPLDDYRYGYTYEGFDNVHTGIDIDFPVGTAIHAAASGKVIWSGFGQMAGVPDPDDPYGLCIVIKHDFGFGDQRLYTLYAHLSQAYVQVGNTVTTGQLIGLVGTTGATTGPHLHFEVRVGENSYFASRNPELWLVPAQGWGVLAGQIKDTAGRLVKGKQVYVQSLDSEDHWTAVTYGARSINSDDYYGENLVVSDLPAGKYKITFEYLYKRYELEVEVFPGRITSFGFQGRKGFITNLPVPADPKLIPASP